MPYWNRAEVLAQNLERYRECYGSGIEIIIVDDGSTEKPNLSGPYPHQRIVIRLPAKDHALNPCTAFNAGVAAASGDIIVLTNPEVIHRSPILGRMAAALADAGPKGYVAAACWGIKHCWWYCHSTDQPNAARVGRAFMPKGAGLHFCSMLNRSFYEDIGGFSEEYRDGQGYEDNDFLCKLEAAGAVFKICDDLVTDHHPCPPCQWPKGGAARNRAIFESKWQHVIAA